MIMKSVQSMRHDRMTHRACDEMHSSYEISMIFIHSDTTEIVFRKSDSQIIINMRHFHHCSCAPENHLIRLPHSLKAEELSISRNIILQTQVQAHN